MAKDKAEIKQNEFLEELNRIRAYSGRGSKYIDLCFKKCNKFL